MSHIEGKQRFKHINGASKSYLMSDNVGWTPKCEALLEVKE